LLSCPTGEETVLIFPIQNDKKIPPPSKSGKQLGERFALFPNSQYLEPWQKFCLPGFERQ